MGETEAEGGEGAWQGGRCGGCGRCAQMRGMWAVRERMMQCRRMEGGREGERGWCSDGG
jgi:hypothetical protein